MEKKGQMTPTRVIEADRWLDGIDELLCEQMGNSDVALIVMELASPMPLCRNALKYVDGMDDWELLSEAIPLCVKNDEKALEFIWSILLMVGENRILQRLATVAAADMNHTRNSDDLISRRHKQMFWIPTDTKEFFIDPWRVFRDDIKSDANKLKRFLVEFNQNLCYLLMVFCRYGSSNKSWPSDILYWQLPTTDLGWELSSRRENLGRAEIFFRSNSRNSDLKRRKK